MNGVQTRFKCKLDVKRCKRFVFPPSSLLPRSNALKTKAIRYFQTDRTLTRIVSPPLQINRCKGDLSLLRLAEETCLCQRHFERKFKQHTGLTPKEYSRIMKFKHAVDLLRSTSFDNLLSVAIKAGYYDVSHLSKEIKKMSGNAPSQLLTSAPLEEGTLSYVKT